MANSEKSDTILGKAVKVDDSLDSLFKNSAGPSEALKKPIPIPIPSTTTDKEPTETKSKKNDDKEDKQAEIESLRKKNRPAILKGEKETKQKEKNQRSVFVGNVPLGNMSKQDHKQFTQLFSQYGKIDSIRFRSFSMSTHMDRKGAFITKQFNAQREEGNAYVVFKSKDAVDACVKALNGTVFMEHHLRVDHADASTVGDHKRSVFLGSLPFDVKDEEIWNFFKEGCQVERVRVIRDAQSNMGKGFGYVQFKNRDSVKIALAMDDKTFREPSHKIRIQHCTKMDNSKDSNSNNNSDNKKFSKKNLKKFGNLKRKNNEKEKGSKRRTLPAPKVMEGTRATKAQGNPLKIAKVVKKAKNKTKTKK
ncbi:hypothetical protein BJ944DRAFT_13479 [Cunninghamella echinulata]|nr:hypothetical protein BJ944DRAFT_13479 [Cunninghamella echinulata]